MVGRAGFEPASRFRPTVFKIAYSPAWTYGIYLVRPTGLEPVLAKANCPLKTACLPNSTRNAYCV